MAKILIADDEALMRRLEADYLKRAGHDVLEAEDGEQAVTLFKATPGIELVTLDIMMPVTDGWEACRRIREISDVPVVLVSARSQDFDQLTGFESGADDYITKPFSPAILVKRIEVLLKRRSGAALPKKDNRVHIGELILDTNAHELTLGGVPVELTLKEYKILAMLTASIGRVYTRDQLLDEIWGMDFFGDIRTVDSHVARLRTKLGKWGSDRIKTVYGIGYKIEADI